MKGVSDVIVTTTSLTVKAGVLAYDPSIWYQFYLETTYAGLNYSQILTIVMTNSAPQVPLVTLA